MKILIIRLSSLGDVLLTTPVLRCLKQQLNNAELHYLTKESASSLLLDNPYLSKVWSLDVSSKSLVKSTINSLRNEHFDYVVDLHNNWRSRRIRRAMHCKCLVYNKENLHKFLFILTKHNFMSGRHVVQRYLDAVKPLGVNDDGLGMDLSLPPIFDVEKLKGESVGHTCLGELLQRPYAVVAFGAQHATKCIPPDKLKLLCYSIHIPVVLLGDEKDRRLLQNWGVSFDNRVYNFCGRTGLLMSAAIIKHAAVVVSADSAMMHVAAAMQRPTVAIFGATDPALGFTPFRTVHVDCVVDDLRCHPCSRQGGPKCPKGHFNCMHLQQWQQIALAANSLASQQ